jgi:hypothetical protein
MDLFLQKVRIARLGAKAVTFTFDHAKDAAIMPSRMSGSCLEVTKITRSLDGSGIAFEIR